MHHAVHAPGGGSGSRWAVGSVVLLVAGLVLTGQVAAAGAAGHVPAPASTGHPSGADRGVVATPDDAGVQLGPATKFVRDADGSVRQVR